MKIHQTGSSLRIRAASPRDLSYFTKLWLVTIGPLWRTEFGATEEIEQQVKRGPDQLEDAHTRIVTYRQHRVAALQLIPRRTTLRIHWLLVEPAFQRQGIGTQLVRLVQEEAASQGLGVGLEVLPCNHDAKRLYERLGFRVALELPHLILMHWNREQ